MITEGPTKNVNVGNARPVMLHGSAGIHVVDIYCPHCNSMNFFDGRRNALFSYSFHTVFTRELLDAWLYGIASNGGTFRKAYDTVRRNGEMFSARHVRNGGYPMLCTRNTSNRDLKARLSLIEYPSCSKLHLVFSCQTCETKTRDGDPLLRAVVLDGTTTGVLGKLPDFDRPKNPI